MALFLDPVSACPVCQSRAIGKGLELFYWRENLVHFYDCQGCGLTFANPMPSDQLIARGNEALVRFYQHGRSFEQEFRDARQAYLRGKVFARKLARRKRHGKVLELGCYQGFFSLGIKDNCGWDVETLEIAPALAEFVRKKLGITCHQGTLESCALPEGEYDFILCHDLIEHINQPEAFLRSLSKLLRPGGEVQILTPNTRQDFAFNRRAFAAGAPPTILLNHIMNFSPRALQVALEKSGLSIKKIYCYGLRHALKDFDLFGMGTAVEAKIGPSLEESLKLPKTSHLDFWTESKLSELRNHPKVSFAYGLIKETIPAALKLKVPARFGVGHEIYALATRK